MHPMRIRHIFLLLAVTFSASLFAQHNEEVTIEGSYRPKVNKVDKLLMTPEAMKPSFEMPGSEIHVLEIEHRFPLELDKLTPVSYNTKKTQTAEAVKNFLMAGFGTRISPVFLYKHNSYLTKNLGLGVGIKHFSSWLDIKDYAPSKFMNNAFDISLMSGGLDNLQVGGGVYYHNDMVHYYGVKPANLPVSVTVDQAAPKQVYNTIGADFGLVSTNTRNGEFVHDLDVAYHYLFAEVGGGLEHDGRLDYDVSYSDNWWGKKNYPQKAGMAMGFQYNHSAFTGSVTDSRMIFHVNPYFEMKDDFYRLHLGVRVDGASLFKSTNERFLTVHPDLRGSLFVLNNTLEFYAGLNGGRKLFTYSDMIKENPYVGTDLQMAVTTVKLGFEGGIRTNILNTLDVHVGVRYRHTMNDPFYTLYGQMVGGSPVENMYDVFYDESHLISVLGDVRWLALDKVTVDAGLAYNNYRLAVLDRASFRPGFEGRLKVNYDPTERLSLYSSFLFQNGRYARTQSPFLAVPSVKLKPVMDLGLGADFRVKDELTVFAKINNLLHQKYQFYYNYPVNGIEFFAGLKMTF